MITLSPDIILTEDGRTITGLREMSLPAGVLIKFNESYVYFLLRILYHAGYTR